MYCNRIKTVFVCTVLLISAAFSSIAFSSCKKEESDSLSDPNDVVCFTDALGREVSVKKQPRRVAALIGSFADVWSLAGGSLCAAASDAWEDFGLELTEAVNLGGAHSPSIELLLSAEPELVIASESTASNIEMKETLEAIGITVIYFDVDNFEDYLHMLDICTDITGRKELYEQNGIRLKEQIENIKKSYAELPLSENERKILLLRASSSSVKAKSSDGTILGEMLADIGCINIADSDKDLLEDLSIEAVIKNEPHHIFAVTMGNDTEAAKASLNNMIKENSAWATLEAVRENRIHIMDKSLFNLKPNARWAEAYEILYQTLNEKSENK